MGGEAIRIAAAPAVERGFGHVIWYAETGRAVDAMFDHESVGGVPADPFVENVPAGSWAMGMPLLCAHSGVTVIAVTSGKR